MLTIIVALTLVYTRTVMLSCSVIDKILYSSYIHIFPAYKINIELHPKSQTILRLRKELINERLGTGASPCVFGSLVMRECLSGFLLRTCNIIAP